MVEVPPLLTCPTCQLQVEAGSAVGGVAFHDCDAVLALRDALAGAAPMTAEDALGKLYQHVVERAPNMNGRDLAGVISALKAQTASEREGDDGEAGVDGAFLKFTRQD